MKIESLTIGLERSDLVEMMKSPWFTIHPLPYGERGVEFDLFQGEDQAS